MQDTELVVRKACCFEGGRFHVLTKNSNPVSAGMLVLVCGQNMIHNYFNSF